MKLVNDDPASDQDVSQSSEADPLDLSQNLFYSILCLGDKSLEDGLSKASLFCYVINCLNLSHCPRITAVNTTMYEVCIFLRNLRGNRIAL